MVYELERVLRVCNGFLYSMSVTYDGAVYIYIYVYIKFTEASHHNTLNMTQNRWM